MKKLIYFLFFLPFMLQAQVNESFTDSTLDKWTGDTNFFHVENGFLHLNGEQKSAVYYLSTANEMAVFCEWAFGISTQFIPSSSNYLRIYLTADSANLKGSLHGYYIQIGESGGHNHLQLFRQDKQLSIPLFSGQSTFSNSSGLKLQIKIQRDRAGCWHLFSKSDNQEDFISEGKPVFDTTYTNSHYAGFYCKYTTASRYNMYAFDYVYIGDIRKDTVKPKIIKCRTENEHILSITFSKEMHKFAQNIDAYEIDQLGKPFKIEQADSFSNTYLLFLNEILVSGKTYQLTCYNLTDCNGNNLSNPVQTFCFYHFDKPNGQDLLINEILFNSYSGGTTFIELYNHSDKFIRLDQVYLGSKDINTGKIKQLYPISKDSNSVLFPRSYLLLSKDKQKIIPFYRIEDVSCFIDMPLFPSFSIQSGYVGICLKDSSIIDAFSYQESMHYPLLTNTKGVSLERISFEKATQSADNWHSAAETAGFATPGYSNSQALLHVDQQASIGFQFPSPIFSPNQDGFQDILEIRYVLNKPGYVCNIHIFNSKGQYVKQLYHNELLGISGSLCWDGTTNARLKADIGVYILYIEIFNTNGEVKKFRKKVVIANTRKF